MMTQYQLYFPHNQGKQPQKRRLSVLREEGKAKRQLREDAVLHQEKAKEFEIECNTVSTQTDITMEFFDVHLKHAASTTETTDQEIQIQERRSPFLHALFRRAFVRSIRNYPLWLIHVRVKSPHHVYYLSHISFKVFTFRISLIAAAMALV